ncbi:MAG: hypothetical protein HZC36_01240 [Armatimonadetes bacterium]|nr:hypothetical protein [Armatimonadota bacterium]
MKVSRLTLLSAIASILLAANAWAWTAQSQAVESKGASGPPGCSKGNEPLPPKAVLAEEIRINETIASRPTEPCTGCTLIMNITQDWCKYRPPGTECFIGPMFDNFRMQRPYRLYQCPDLSIGVCCGYWNQNGCCNNSSSEIECWDQDASYRCSETPNCP